MIYINDIVITNISYGLFLQKEQLILHLREHSKTRLLKIGGHHHD